MSTLNDNQRLLSYSAALQEAVDQEMERDESVFTFGLDVDDHVAIQGSTQGLLEKYGPERIFSTPLSEDSMTGFAVGAAMAGMRPIHVHIRQDFLLLCMNQLVNMAAKTHYMYGGVVKVPLVVRAIIGKSWGQGPQHSQALYSLFAHIPGLKVAAPSNASDAKGCMAAAIRDDNPVIFNEHRMLYYTEAYVLKDPFEIKPGKARVSAEGEDVTLVGISNMVVECLRARDLLAEKGISVEVIDPIWLKPMDLDTVIRSFNKTGRLLVVDNAWTACGMSAEILASIAETINLSNGMQLQRMGFAPVTCPTSPTIEDKFYPNPATIASKVYSMLNPTKQPWKPDPEKAKLAYQSQFKGPF